MQFLEMYHQHSCPILKLKAHAPIFDEGYSLVCKVGLAMDSKVKASNLTERFLALKIVEIEGRSSNTRGELSHCISRGYWNLGLELEM